MTTPAIDYDAIYRFLASPEAMERVKEVPDDLPTLDRRADDWADTGLDHRRVVAHSPQHQAMRTPPITVPWPTTVEEWRMWAMLDQMFSEARRLERRESRRHRREMWQELAVGGAFVLVMYVMAWLWALVAA